MTNYPSSKLIRYDFFSKDTVKKMSMSQAWWHMAIVLALGKQRQKNQELKVIISLHSEFRASLH